MRVGEAAQLPASLACLFAGYLQPRPPLSASLKVAIFTKLDPYQKPVVLSWIHWTISTSEQGQAAEPQVLSPSAVATRRGKVSAPFPRASRT